MWTISMQIFAMVPPKAVKGRKTLVLGRLAPHESPGISKCGEFKLGAKIIVLMGHHTI